MQQGVVTRPMYVLVEDDATLASVRNLMVNSAHTTGDCRVSALSPYLLRST